MRRIPQKIAILRYLQAGHTLSPLEALNLFGSFRLGARIYDLRTQHGIDIQSKMVDGHAEYFLEQWNCSDEDIALERADMEVRRLVEDGGV